MEIRFAPYVLRSRGFLSAKASGSERAGALLRIETVEGVGFADLHPWPELGDLPLEKQLELLAEGQLTPLTRRSLEMAKLDCQARRLGQNAFIDLEVPPSHFLINDLTAVDACVLDDAYKAGFRALKIKVGRNLNVETETLRKFAGSLSNFRLRFDFNGSLDEHLCLKWLDALPQGLHSSIEFFEDPLPWDKEQWRELCSKTQVSLALDRVSEGEDVSADSAGAFDYLVLKPAVQDAEKLVARSAKSEALRFVLTSYMDHPVGQVGAALIAARVSASAYGKRLGDCGLLTHTCFESNKYSDAIAIAGAKLIPPSGTGIGFDDLLEREDWKKLK